MLSAVTDQGWWDWLPNNTRSFFKPLVNMTNPIGNYFFDQFQNNLNRQLSNFSSDENMGLFSLIPKSLRNATSGIASALAKPITAVGDLL